MTQSDIGCIVQLRDEAHLRPVAQPFGHSPIPEAEAPRDCRLCPRLVSLREELQIEHPNWWNAPVPAFGDPDAWLAIVGLAPGRRGANRTGRPFTGDYSGEIFYSTLLKFGLAHGVYLGEPDDDLTLVGTIVLNAVKCLPPNNKPMPQEVSNCRNYLQESLASLPNVKVIVALGQIAHSSAAKVLRLVAATTKFAHGAEALTRDGRLLLASYHCSRQNTNTGRLSQKMFEAIFERALEYRS